MSIRTKALSLLIIGLGAGSPVFAQSGAPPLSATALGAGLTLPQASETTADTPPPVGGVRYGWWSLADAEKRFDFGVSVAPRLGFYGPADADIGPGLRWRSAAGTLTATYGLDPTGGSRGENIQFNFSRPVISEQGFRMLAFVGAEWQSGRDRMFASPVDTWNQPARIRPLYSSGAATNVGFGLDSYYQLTKSSAIMVGASGLRLGGAPADGALYTNRWQAILYGGYAIRF